MSTPLQSGQPNTSHLTEPNGEAATVRDAARYRWLRDHGLKYANVGLGSDCDGGNVVDFSPTFTIPEPVGMSYENNEWSLDDLDAAIDAAIAAATGSQP
jgi:hypothetical protein